jgi:hypothetical protein
VLPNASGIGEGGGYLTDDPSAEGCGDHASILQVVQSALR